MSRTLSAIESFAMTNYRKGQFFITTKADKDITAIATYYSRQVKTERYVGIDAKTMSKTIKLTRVTFV